MTKITRTLRIAMLCLHLPKSGENSGVDYQVHYLANALVERGHYVRVFSLSPKPDDAKYDVKKIEMPKFATGKKIFRIFLYPFFLRMKNYSGFDIIHSHGNDYLFFMFSKPILRTFYGTALLESFYAKTISRKIYQFIWYLLEYLSGFNARYKSAISRETKRYLQFVNDIIPCGINCSLFSVGKTKSRNPSILFIGTMQGRKRGNFLLSLFKREILPRIPNAELWLVSDKKAKEKKVISFGRVSTKKLIQLYQKSWLFCNPSTYEGFGVPYIEAMSCGTAVVSSPNKGAIEVLEDGYYGILSEDADIADALIGLLKNGKFRNKQIERGVKYAKKFSFGMIAERYENIYFKITKFRL